MDHLPKSAYVKKTLWKTHNQPLSVYTSIPISDLCPGLKGFHAFVCPPITAADMHSNIYELDAASLIPLSYTRTYQKQNYPNKGQHLAVSMMVTAP